MTLLQHIASEITFFNVCMSLIAVGLIERGLYMLPESVVGEGGWLLDTGPAV